MENTTYIYSTDENVMGPRKKQDRLRRDKNQKHDMHQPHD